MKGRIVFVGAAILATVVFLAGCPNGSDGPPDDSDGLDDTDGLESSGCLIASFVFKAADNAVLSVDLPGTVFGNAITAAASLFCPLHSLTPTIEVSAGATVLPASGVAEDFAAPVFYIVTAEDGTVDSYIVTLSNGTVTVLAGQAWSFGSADGTGTAATFYAPDGIDTDGTNFYVADTQNSTIRKIVIATGEVSTIAGTAGVTGYDAVQVDAADARFYRPSGITYDDTMLYIADTLNNNIRVMDLGTNKVTALGLQVNYHSPKGITTDGANLYISDTAGNRILKEVIGDSQISTIAGHALAGYWDDIGTLAAFAGPTGIATDGTNLYVADTLNNAIRKVVIATKEVTTLAGHSQVAGITDGVGAEATFNAPRGLTLMGTSLYIADTENSRLRRLDLTTNAVDTLVETSGILSQPCGILNDGTNLYVTTWSSMIAKVQ